jgi:mono/diheme cytochrome c family protein
MAIDQILGLFEQVSEAVEAIHGLRKAGITDDQMTVLSGTPYHSEILNRPNPRGGVGKIALFGALLGVATAVVLTVGLFLLYPIVAGGQPIVPIPPSLIVLFEMIMLGTMWAAFFGMLFKNHMPVLEPQVYDPHITEGYIGVQVAIESSKLDEVEGILKDWGGQFIQRLSAVPPKDRRNQAFWAGAGVAIVLVGVVSLLFFYDILKIPFPTQMAEQDSFGFEQGPRLAAPAESIPIQGPVLINGQPASQPVPATPDSINRGKAFFAIHCALCHGATGAGNGTIGTFFTPKPSDLTNAGLQSSLSDADIFLTITQGYNNVMPSLAEDLDVSERWDVVNYMRTLNK